MLRHAEVYILFSMDNLSPFWFAGKSIGKNVVKYPKLCVYCVECNPKLITSLTGVSQHKSAK